MTLSLVLGRFCLDIARLIGRPELVIMAQAVVYVLWLELDDLAIWDNYPCEGQCGLGRRVFSNSMHQLTFDWDVLFASLLPLLCQIWMTGFLEVISGFRWSYWQIGRIINNEQQSWDGSLLFMVMILGMRMLFKDRGTILLPHRVSNVKARDYLRG